MFIQARQRKGILDTIRAIQVRGPYFALFQYNKEEGVLPKEVHMQHAGKDSQSLERAIDQMKHSVVRQLLSLCAQSEVQVMSLWSEVLEEHFLTLPDPTHGVCSCDSCCLSLWKMAAQVEALPDGTTLNVLAILDALHPSHPAVVIVACSASGLRSETQGERAMEQLSELCGSICGGKSRLGMGDLLYAADAHGRCIRWYSYSREDAPPSMKPRGVERV